MSESIEECYLKNYIKTLNKIIKLSYSLLVVLVIELLTIGYVSITNIKYGNYIIISIGVIICVMIWKIIQYEKDIK